jgi:hypothetical protein
MFLSSWITDRIGNALAQYQDPAQADSLTKVQKELDLTKEFMVRVCMLSSTRIFCVRADTRAFHAFLEPPSR